MANIKFPDDFQKKSHPSIPFATQWIWPKEGKTQISIVGGGRGLYGDGVRTFEMYDFKLAGEPEGYMLKEEINELLSKRPEMPIETTLEQGE